MPAALNLSPSDTPTQAPGPYTLGVSATVSAPSGAHPLEPTTFEVVRTFTVGAPGWGLPAGDVLGVFPPDNSAGGYPDALPHVVLAERSRPWQRTADGGTLPWLAVLVFTEHEAPVVRSVAFEDLNTGEGVASFPSPSAWAPQPDRVAVIDVEPALLAALLPSSADLALLAHVRDHGEQEPVAVVVANRAPPPDSSCVAHLVSVEGRYDADGFRFEGAGPADRVRLVTLHRWRFTASGSARFEDLAKGVGRRVDTLKRTIPEQHSRAARLAEAGFVPLHHRLRDAETTISLYHGPLLPAPSEVSLPLPASFADALLFAMPEVGLLDVSYAAAWTLGRLLALADRTFSTSFQTWLHERAQLRGLRAQTQTLARLPLRGESKRRLTQAERDPALPDALRDWLLDRGALRGVPFRYLVPDEALLPVESMRFFTVDATWIRCLLDGVRSIGALGAEDLELPEPPPLTGFLLRSELVSAFPDLHVEATGAGAPLRSERASESVLLYLYAGDLESVTLSRAPLLRELGVFSTGEGAYVPLRGEDGAPLGTSVEVPFRIDRREGVIEVATLAASMGASLGTTLDSAGFAFQLMQTAGALRVLRSGTP